MRSFTKKNLDYTSSTIGDSLYKLLYTDGSKNHILLLRNEFETPEFKKAANALISLAVQRKKEKWDALNSTTPLNVKSIIDVGELKKIYLAIAQKDYVINTTGVKSEDIFTTPQPGKTIDFRIIKNTDGIKFTDIETLLIDKQFFNTTEMVAVFKNTLFPAGTTPLISDVVLKNMAKLILLRQILLAVRFRSKYENLFGFKYPDVANAIITKLNCFIYKSVIPVTSSIPTLLHAASVASATVYTNKTKSPCISLSTTAEAVEEAGNCFTEFINKNKKPKKASVTKIDNYLDDLDLVGKMAGKAKAQKAITSLSKAVESIIKNKDLSDCTKKLDGALKKAIATVKDIAKSKPINNNNPKLSDITNTIINAFKSLQRQIDDSGISNSSSFSTTHQVSEFRRIVATTNIIAAQNPAISALAPNHIRFVEDAGKINWLKQGTADEFDAAGLSLIPFDEGEKVINGYINSATPDKPGNTVERQGVQLMNYIRPHFDKKADNGYRNAKSAMIFRQGLYCAFCETPFTDGRVVDIEHKLPKAIFPTQSLNWNNFVLSCKVCNSDNKGEKYVNSSSDVDNSKVKFSDNTFKPRTKGVKKDYLECRKIAEQEVLWPDKKHEVESKDVKHNLLSFQAIQNELPKGLKPKEVEPSVYAFVHTKPAGAGKTHRIDIKGFSNGSFLNDVSVVLKKAGNLPDNTLNNTKVGIQASTEHIISICGLDKTGGSYWNDQRVVNRTKAWLNAMKQLKILADFNVEKFSKLYNYYQAQLHPVNIRNKPVAPNHTNIEKLIDDTTAPIVLDEITGLMHVSKNIPTGKVNIRLTQAVAVTGNFSINNVSQNVVTLNKGILTGEIIEEAAGRTFTGRLEIGANTTAHDNKIILFKEVAVDIPRNPTIFNIQKGHGGISNNAQLGTAGSPAEKLKEWDSNMADMLQLIDQATTTLQNFLWENIIDMVRMGGFYSTWVSTFKENCSQRNPFDIELVHRLERKALENQDDPFQFHGTDAEEILSGL